MAELEVKKRKQEYLAKTVAIKEDYKALLEKEEAIVDVQERLTDWFKHSIWKNLDINAEYKITAFTVNTSGKWPHVGVLAETDGIEHVFYIRGHAKNLFINLHSRLDMLKTKGYVVSKCGGLDVVHLATEKPFAEFRTDGLQTFNGHSFAKIVNLKFYTDVSQECGGEEETPAYTHEDVESFNNITMQQIKGKIKIADCSRLEEVEEGSELTVKAMQEVYYRKRIRYVLEFDNIASLFLSNYWLEKEIDSSDMDLNYKLKIKLDTLKTTPTKKMERLVFCVIHKLK